MTPAARVQAASEIIDQIAGGMAAEKALTNWARGARYAGSKDRAAVRDHVFDALRRWRSSAVLGGGESGRLRMLGLLRELGPAPAEVFTGGPHGPAPLTEEEAAGGAEPEGAAALDLPDWLWERLRESQGEAAAEVALSLRDRAEVFLRINALKVDADAALEVLAADGISAEPHSGAAGALRVTQGARKIARSRAYLDGLVELQDASSQAVVEALPLEAGQWVLDYCAGGGGKTLALAARLGGGPVLAHDANPRRMSDLPARAERAGATVEIVSTPSGPHDLVLCDAPCSGSGAWRRSPEGKWRLRPGDLERLAQTQGEILDTAAGLVAPGGVLAYVTCSVLAQENGQVVDAFLARHPEFEMEKVREYRPGPDGDGFFLAVLRQAGQGGRDPSQS